jgi:hypothetical protein
MRNTTGIAGLFSGPSPEQMARIENARKCEVEFMRRLYIPGAPTGEADALALYNQVRAEFGIVAYVKPV